MTCAGDGPMDVPLNKFIRFLRGVEVAAPYNPF